MRVGLGVAGDSSKPSSRVGAQVPEAGIRVIHTPGPYEHFVKPTFDRAAALGLLVILAPILLVLGVAVRLTMGRPVLFRQRRVGYAGRQFTVLKYRTMIHDRRMTDLPFEGPDRRRVHKSANDPRVTRVGRFLRKWSLDELPQLVNVVRGEMSLVGPRPELPDIVAGYEPWQHDRHQVYPGITGLWQVSVRNDGRLMHEATEYDIAYVETISPATDAAILAITIPAALGLRKGV